MAAVEKSDTGVVDSPSTPDSFINRELSWLQFARRELEVAQAPETPLLERVKFAGILGMIYDEFVMKRVGGLRRQLEREKQHKSADGLTPLEEFTLSRDELNRQTGVLSKLVEEELRPALADIGVPLLEYDDLSDEQQGDVDRVFDENVLPILTPLSADAGHPFPFISGLSLNLAVSVKLPGKKRERFIRIKVPPNRDRWMEVPGGVPVGVQSPVSSGVEQIVSKAQSPSAGRAERTFHVFSPAQKAGTLMECSPLVNKTSRSTSL